MNSLMTDEVWAAISHFKKTEAWGDPYKVAARLVFALEKVRVAAGRPIVIHCAYETGGHNPKGYHPRGMAADFHIEGMHVVDQYLLVSKLPDFGGIGLYPYWNNPGLHADVGQPGRRWARNKAGVYVALGWAFLSALAKGENP